MPLSFFLSKSLTSKLFASVFILTMFFVSVPQTATAQRKKKHIVSKAESDSLRLLATRKNTALFSDGLRERLTGNDANAIENFNRQLRKVTKTKSAFVSDDALMKLLYLTTMGIVEKWTMPVKEWGTILDHLMIYFGDRVKISL